MPDRGGPPAVVAYLGGGVSERELAAGFEEEQVPLELGRAEGDRWALARRAAAAAALGLGIGGDPGGFVLVLATRPGAAYLEAAPEDARAFGHAVARIAARRVPR